MLHKKGSSLHDVRCTTVQDSETARPLKPVPFLAVLHICYARAVSTRLLHLGLYLDVVAENAPNKSLAMGLVTQSQSQ